MRDPKRPFVMQSWLFRKFLFKQNYTSAPFKVASYHDVLASKLQPFDPPLNLSDLNHLALRRLQSKRTNKGRKVMRRMSCTMLYLNRVEWPMSMHVVTSWKCQITKHAMVYRESRVEELAEDRSGSMSASPQYISTPSGKEKRKLKHSSSTFIILINSN